MEQCRVRMNERPPQSVLLNVLAVGDITRFYSSHTVLTFSPQHIATYRCMCMSSYLDAYLICQTLVITAQRKLHEALAQ